MNNILYCWRSLMRSAGFSATVLLLLALGIGANVAFLALLHRALFLGPSGVEGQDLIARLYFRTRSNPALQLAATVDAVDVQELRDALRPHGDLATYSTAVGVPVGKPRTANVNVTFARHDYFEFFKIHPQLGRFFTADEVPASDASGSAILSDRLWRRLGADTGMVGRLLDINREQYRVLGVTPVDFHGFDIYASDVWILRSSEARDVQMLVRRAENVKEVALAEIVTTVLQRRFGMQRAGDTTITAVSGPSQYTQLPSHRPPQVTVLIRLGMIALAVLLIAAANVGNLILARGFARQREFAVRVALGASRARLFALSLTETALLALIASVVAATIGYIGQNFLQSQYLAAWHWATPRFGLGVALIVLALTGVAVLGAGLAPAWKLSKMAPGAVLRASLFDRSLQRSTLRSSFVAAQAALTFSLLMVGSAVALSLLNVMRVDIGYDVERITEANVYYSSSVSASAAQTMSLVASRLRGRPDVEAVAVVTRAPFQGVTYADSLFLPDQPIGLTLKNGPVSWIGVTPEFFRAAGMRVLQGRAFDEQDDRPANRIIVVNQNMADQLWPSGPAVDQCVHFGRAGPCYRVIGVAEDARRFDITEPPTPAFFVPLSAVPFPDNPPRAIVVRSKEAGLAAVDDALRRELQKAFPGVDFVGGPLRNVISEQERPWRTSAVVLTMLAVLALIVTTLGVYGAVSYSVTQRIRELGIRIALGARIKDLVASVLREEMRPVIIGILVGVGISVWVGRFLGSLLYQVSPHDWTVVVSVGALLGLVAAAAAIVPTIRVTRVDPSTVMRAE